MEVLQQREETVGGDPVLSQTVLDSLPAAFYVLGQDGRVKYWNARAEEITGLSPDEIEGRKATRFFREEARSRISDTIQTVFEKGHAEVEERIVLKDRPSIPAVLTGVRTRIDGEPHLVGMGIDTSEQKRQQQALRQKTRELEEKEHRLRQITENIEETFWLRTADRMLFVSPSFEDLWGRPSERLFENVDAYLEWVHPEDREGVEAACSRMVANDKPLDLEYRIVRPDGEIRWLDVEFEPIPHQHGDVRYAGVFRDITERKHAEQALREREEQFRTLFEEHSAPMLLIEPQQGQIVQANEAAAAFYGHSLEDLTSMTIDEINQLPPDEVEARRADARSRNQNHFVFPHRLKSGEVRTVEVHSTPITTQQGTLLFSIIHDVTEQQEAERELRRSKETYQGILDAARDSIYVLDEDGTFLAANDSTATMLGQEVVDLIGRPLTDVLAPEQTDLEETKDALEAAASGKERRLELHAERADGSVFPKDVRLQPVEYFGEDAILGVGRDITERRKAERDVQQATARYETLVENFPGGGVFMFDRDLRYSLAGGLGLAQVGLSRSEIEGRTPRDLFTEDVARETEEHYQRALEGERSVYTQSFQDRDYRVQTLPVRDESGEVVAGIAVSQDITERNRRKERLRHRKAKVDALYDAANRLVRASNREEVGKVLTELIQNTLRYRGVSVRFEEEGQLKVRHVAESTFEFMPERPDFDIDGTSAVAAVYRSGETLVVEDVAEVETEDPHDYGDLRSVVVVPMGEHGTFAVASPEPEAISEFDRHLIEVLGTYATAVLDRIEKEATLQRAKVEAETASQLKTALLQNVSHELRTPLTSITSFSGILEEELTGQMQKYARLVNQGGERLMNTLEALLKLSRLEAGEEDLTLRPVRLQEAARSAVESNRQRAEAKGLTIELVAPSPPIRAQANGEAMSQVLSHLVDNAIKFTEAGGAVTVRLRQADDRVTIEVEDTGVGISEEAQSDIFRPFAQESKGLDRQFEGSGLGLAVAKLLVGEMNGTIEVESEKGTGSRFIVSLPPAREEAS
jgi:PAS domain S-box-containing protein